MVSLTSRYPKYFRITLSWKTVFFFQMYVTMLYALYDKSKLFLTFLTKEFFMFPSTKGFLKY